MPRRIARVEATPLQQWAAWAGGEGLVFLLIAGLVYLARPEMTWYIKVGLGLGIAGILFYLAVLGPSLGRMIFRRRTLQDLNGAVFVIALLAIFGLVNYVADRRHTQWDLTKIGRYTLSDQTRQILKRLNQKVTVTALYPSDPREPGGSDRVRVEDLLKQYQTLNDRISIKFVDPWRDPSIYYAKELDKERKQPPLVLFETENRHESVTGSQERDFTGALLKLTTTQKKKIYFLQGHGELDPDRQDLRTGISSIKAVLVAQQHDVAPLTLAGLKPRVPADAAALVIAGPRQALFPAEEKAIEEFLQNGGHVLLMIGPRGPDFSGLLKPWGITVGKGVVADTLAIQTLTTPVTATYEPHEITDSLRGRLCAFPYSRPVNVATPAPAGVTTQPLVRTSTNSWVETHPEKGIRYDSQDIKGPVTLAAVATKDLSPTPPPSPGAPPPGPRKMARFVVIGSSDFASDYWARFAQILNPYLVLNAVNWLAEEDALVSIPPKDDQPETVMLSDSQKRGLAIINFLIFPGLAVLAGLVTWWKRR